MRAKIPPSAMVLANARRAAVIMMAKGCIVT